MKRLFPLFVVLFVWAGICAETSLMVSAPLLPVAIILIGASTYYAIKGES